MKRLKKIVASLLAISSMTVCMSGISASAWTLSYTKGAVDSANTYYYTETRYTSSGYFYCQSYYSTTNAKAYVGVSSGTTTGSYLSGAGQRIDFSNSTSAYIACTVQLKDYSGGTSTISGTING